MWASLSEWSSMSLPVRVRKISWAWQPGNLVWR